MKLDHQHCKAKSNPTNPRDDIGQSHRCLKCRFEKIIMYSIAALGWLLVLGLYFALTITPKVSAPTIQLLSNSNSSQSVASSTSSILEPATIRTGGH